MPLRWSLVGLVHAVDYKHDAPDGAFPALCVGSMWKEQEFVRLRLCSHLFPFTKIWRARCDPVRLRHATYFAFNLTRKEQSAHSWKIQQAATRLEDNYLQR
jgi:hypothetical protein